MKQVISFHTDDGKTIEIMRLDDEGMIYLGQRISNPIEADGALTKVMDMMKQKVNTTLNSKNE